jgi:hypothetical protein
MATFLLITDWGKRNPTKAIPLGLGLDFLLIIFIKKLLTT